MTWHHGKLPGSFIAEYPPWSFGSTDVPSADNIFDFVGGAMGLVRIRDCVSCIVGAFEQVFVKVHKDVDCKRDIDDYMAVHEFCQKWHFQNHHSVFLLEAPEDDPARVINYGSLLKLLWKVVCAFAVLIAAVAWWWKVIVLVHVIFQNLIS